MLSVKLWRNLPSPLCSVQHLQGTSSLSIFSFYSCSQSYSLVLTFIFSHSYSPILTHLIFLLLYYSFASCASCSFSYCSFFLFLSNLSYIPSPFSLSSPSRHASSSVACFYSMISAIISMAAGRQEGK